VMIVGVGLGAAFAGGVAFGKTQQEETATTSPRLGGVQLSEQAGGAGTVPAGPGGGGRNFGGGGLGGDTVTGTAGGFRGSAGAMGGATSGEGSGGLGGLGGLDGSGDFAGRRGGGLAGTVTQLEGDTLTIETAPGETQQVTLAADLLIQKSVAGTREDLVAGTQVRIIGQPDDQGTMQTQLIVITPEGASAAFEGVGPRGDRERDGGSAP